MNFHGYWCINNTYFYKIIKYNLQINGMYLLMKLTAKYKHFDFEFECGSTNRSSYLAINIIYASGTVKIKIYISISFIFDLYV